MRQTWKQTWDLPLFSRTHCAWKLYESLQVHPCCKCAGAVARWRRIARKWEGSCCPCFPHRTHFSFRRLSLCTLIDQIQERRLQANLCLSMHCWVAKLVWRVALAARCFSHSTFYRQQTAKIVEWTSQLGEWNWPMVSHHHMNVSLPIEFNYDSSDSNYKYWVCIGLVSSKLMCSYPLSNVWVDLHKSCLWVPIGRDWINLRVHLQNLVECHLMWI